MAGSFGELLRRFRVGASLTQEALAERCRLSPATIAAIEQGRRNAPRLSTVRLIADALELSVADRATLAHAAAGKTATTTNAATTATDGAVAATRVTTDGGAARAAPGPGRLPAALTPLFGRHADADSVIHELATERLVTLTGPGGVGKTRLAQEVASGTLDKFAGGTYWVELGPVTDPGQVPEAVLRALGATEQPRAEVLDQLLAVLPREPTLLAIDNCEHVLDAAAALIAGLLTNSPVTVLATSREPLAIPGEVRRQVEALPVPDPDTPATAQALAGVDSVQLFAERASRADPGFAMTDAASGPVARIVRRLDGIPLAIELAAARMGTRSADRLARELDEQIPLTAAANQGFSARHGTLQACIDWSYRLLTGPEQAAFRCLACFAGSFTAEAFCAVTAEVAGLTSAEALYSLTRKSLVALEAPTGRYRVLDTIAAFATQQAGGAGELAAIRDAQAGYCVSWLAGLDAMNATDDVLDLIETDYPNLRAALAWSIETGSPRAAGIVAGLGNVWQEHAHFHDAITLADGALNTPRLSAVNWAKAVAALGNARLLGGDGAFEAALSRAEQIARMAHDDLTQGWCLLTLGMRPPFDDVRLPTAYRLGAAGTHLTLATLGAVFYASGGTGEHREEWLRRADEFGERLANASADATRRLAWADSLIERGRLAEALDLTVPAACDPRVMPSTRLLGIGRTLQVAFYRRDPRLAERAAMMNEELSQVWPVGASWLTSSWKVFGGLLEMWAGLLRGERPPPVNLETLGRMVRTGLTPTAVRTICRTAIDRGDRLQPADVAMSADPPAPGSLMAASFGAVEAAHATLDGEPALARRLWSDVLSVAAPHGYLLLVCDALEGLGYLASQQDDLTRAGLLLAAARGCRDDITYRYRFGFEQELLDRAGRSAGSPAGPEHPLAWQAAVTAALAR
jgi:predicted ATPase/transcriptional regulator with XRE-family HTH domain